MVSANSVLRVPLLIQLVLELGFPVQAARAAEEPAEPWMEVWAGADASATSWLVYTGATVAPFGGIYDNGWRVRTVAGYGEYNYSYAREKVDRRGRSKTSEHLSFDGTTTYSEGLIGYLQRFGPLTAKAFGGVSSISHEIEPFDHGNDVFGPEVGPKAVLELWLNVGNSAWTSVDLSWTSAHDTRAARVRTGYRVVPTVSTGLEAGFDANSQALDWTTGEGSFGAFLRYEWNGGEISASGGISGQVDGNLEIPTAPYGTINWIAHYEYRRANEKTRHPNPFLSTAYCAFGTFFSGSPTHAPPDQVRGRMVGEDVSVYLLAGIRVARQPVQRPRRAPP